MGNREATARHLGANPAPATDWLFNRLTVSGPAGAVTRFRAAARGTGGIPWHLDLDHEEARLFAPMAGEGAEARALARELREMIAARHDRVLARWHEAGGCPFDLHRLIPIPGAILTLGADAPAARQWLWAHWGTTEPLRQVRVLQENGDRRLRRSARVVYEFVAADWTPWQALLRLRQDWPQLVLTVDPRYGEPDGAGEARQVSPRGSERVQAEGVLAKVPSAERRRNASEADA